MAKVKLQHKELNELDLELWSWPKQNQLARPSDNPLEHTDSAPLVHGISESNPSDTAGVGSGTGKQTHEEQPVGATGSGMGGEADEGMREVGPRAGKREIDQLGTSLLGSSGDLDRSTAGVLADADRTVELTPEKEAEISAELLLAELGFTITGDSIIKSPKPELWSAPGAFTIPVLALDRLKANVEACQTLFNISKANREATESEKVLLAKFTGWGFAPDSISSSKVNEARTMSNSLLDILGITPFHPDTYLNVDPQTKENFEFFSQIMARHCSQGAKVLITETPLVMLLGNLPSDFAKTGNISFLAQDEGSASIAKLLYKGVQITSKEEEIPEGYYDLSYSPHRYRVSNFIGYRKPIETILSRVREGGLVFATSSQGHLMDLKVEPTREDLGIRHDISKEFELLSAVRDTQLKQDRIIFQRRTTLNEDILPWVEVEERTNKNHYFTINTGNVGLFSDEVLLEKSLLLIPEFSFSDLSKISPTKLKASISERQTIIERGGKVYRNLGGSLDEILLPDVEDKNKVLAIISLRDFVKETNSEQRGPDPDKFNALLEGTKEAYSKFEEQYGRLNNHEALLDFFPFSERQLLHSLEVFNTEKEVFERSTYFSKVHEPVLPGGQIDSPKHALQICIQEKGQVDVPFLSKILKLSEEDAQGLLVKEGHIFKEPIANRFVTADNYLSGDVVGKLALVRKVSKIDPEVIPNIEALEKVQPLPKTIEHITLNPGAPWISAPILEKWIKDTDVVTVTIERKENGGWTIHASEKTRKSAGVIARKVGAYDGVDIYRAAINNTNPTIFYPKEKVAVENPDGTITVKEIQKINWDDTQLIRTKVHEFRGQFAKWVKASPANVTALENLYNKNVNRFVEFKPDTSLVNLRGLNPDLKHYDYQLNAAARAIQMNNSLVNHFAGAGKSVTFATVANHRLSQPVYGKVMQVLPAKTLHNYIAEVKWAFPDLPVVILDREAFRNKQNLQDIKESPKAFVVTSFEVFSDIAMSEGEVLSEFNLSLADARIQLMQANTTSKHKIASEKIKNLEVKRSAALLEYYNKGGVTIKDLGINHLMVDEAHILRNLKASGGGSETNMSGNDLTEDFLKKITLLRKENPNFSITMGTGTLFNRTAAELYTYQQYLQPEALKAMGILSLNNWVSTFGTLTPTLDSNLKGELVMRDKFRLANVSSLYEMVNSQFDIIHEWDVKGKVNVPDIEGGKSELVLIEKTPAQSAYYKTILDRIKGLSKPASTTPPAGTSPTPVEEKKDNMLNIYHDSMRNALDVRMVDPGAPAEKGGKLDTCAERVAKIYFGYNDKKAVQIVFCDEFRKTIEDATTKKQLEVFNAHDELKNRLIALGIPENEICIMNDVPAKKMEQTLEDIRKGKIRVPIGSRSTIGLGVNVQNLVKAVHDLDTPWNPASLIQGHKRGVRQGNIFPEVNVIVYAVKGSGEIAKATRLDYKVKQFNDFFRHGKNADVLDDISEIEVSQSELVAEILGDPRYVELTKLQYEKENLERIISAAETEVYYKKHQLPYETMKLEGIFKESLDLAVLGAHITENDEKMKALPTGFEMTVGDKVFTDREAAAKELHGQIDIFEKMGGILVKGELVKGTSKDPVKLASVLGMNITAQRLYSSAFTSYALEAKDQSIYIGNEFVSKEPLSRLTSVMAKIRAIPKQVETKNEQIKNQTQIVNDINAAIEKPSEYGKLLETVKEKIQILAKDIQANPVADAGAYADLLTLGDTKKEAPVVELITGTGAPKAPGIIPKKVI